MSVEVTLFQGRVGDHNDLAMPGAQALGQAIARTLNLDLSIVGSPEPALNTSWDVELQKARPALLQLGRRFEEIYARGNRSIAATSRCAASIATLPVVTRFHPDACVVWFDAHADLNTPTSTTSGYLGGLALAAPLGIWDSGFGSGLAFKNVILVGQRDIDPFEVRLMRDKAISHITPGPAIGRRLREAIGRRPVYLHLDCDVLNPGIVPTDYVHEGGLTLDDLAEAMTALAHSEVVGAEIAEFQNSWFPGDAPVSPNPLISALLPLIHKLTKDSA